MEQHEQHTDCKLQTVVADPKDGTAENFVACHHQGVVTHLGRCQGQARQGRRHFQRRSVCVSAGQRPLFMSRGSVVAAAALRAAAAGLGICRRPSGVCRRRLARAMHALATGADRQPARTRGGIGSVSGGGAQRGGPAGSAAAAAFDRRQFCRRRQPSRVQTRALATVVAATNSGLPDRGQPEQPDFAGAQGSETRRQRGPGLGKGDLVRGGWWGGFAYRSEPLCAAE